MFPYFTCQGGWDPLQAQESCCSHSINPKKKDEANAKGREETNPQTEDGVSVKEAAAKRSRLIEGGGEAYDPVLLSEKLWFWFLLFPES